MVTDEPQARARSDAHPAAGSKRTAGLGEERVKYLLAASAAVGALAMLVLTALKYDDEAKGIDIVEVGLGGHASAPGLVNTAVTEDAARNALRWDFLLIAGYGTALTAGVLLALWFLRTPGARRWVWFGGFTAVIAVVADCVENLLLLLALSDVTTVKLVVVVSLWDAASVASVVKFCALGPAAATAATGLAMTMTRLVRRRVLRRRFYERSRLASDEYSRALPLLCADPPAEISRSTGDALDDGRLARWARGYHVPTCTHPNPAPGEEVKGICLSGGGVRAASVALGVLQSPTFRDRVVSQAQYLVSVSGGGYTAGAFAHVLTDAQPSTEAAAPDGAEVVHDLADSALMVGSPEEDHIRRHSSYIADTPSQMVTALGLLAGHLLMTLTLLFGPAVLLGIALGLFYRRVPITEFEWTADHADFTPVVRDSALWAVGIAAGLTVLVLLAVQFGPAHFKRHPHETRRTVLFIGESLLGLIAVIVVVTVVLPRVMWLSARWTDSGGGRLQVAPIVGVLVTYAASLATLAWRNRSLVRKRFRRGGAQSSVAPRGLVQIVLVITALVMLIAGWLAVLGGVAAEVLAHPPDRTQWILAVVLLAVLLLLGGLTDETTLSLHPFYRERLASAFAVRRVRRRLDGQIVAQPYPPAEVTCLSRYAAMPKGTPFPHIIFAASATLGQERTPPGSNRVSYTFCSDWVGGPDLGYVRTESMENLVPRRLKRDLTVQGAMALSGAAIAASVSGQGSAWYEPLLVVSGVRLGAWMPNPAFLIEQCQTPTTPTLPEVPRTRRFKYLLRELFGVHTLEGPLVHVTDGGFYDNLGLLELFRRGCTRIYCVDASGDSPPAAMTLARSLTRAYQELGVETQLSENTWSTATAGSGEKLTPADPLAALSQRLASTGIITGDFSYPACGRFAGRTGKLVVAKASLWSKLPYKLMAYAHEATVFPHDSTADQWFDDRQYAAYTELGRWLGEAAVTTMDAITTAPKAPSPTPGSTLIRRRIIHRLQVPVVSMRTTDVLQPDQVLAAVSPANGDGRLPDQRRGFELTIRWRA